MTLQVMVTLHLLVQVGILAVEQILVLLVRHHLRIMKMGVEVMILEVIAVEEVVVQEKVVMEMVRLG
jgi:hypothetical protein